MADCSGRIISREMFALVALHESLGRRLPCLSVWLSLQKDVGKVDRIGIIREDALPWTRETLEAVGGIQKSFCLPDCGAWWWSSLPDNSSRFGERIKDEEKLDFKHDQGRGVAERWEQPVIATVGGKEGTGGIRYI